MKFIGDFKKLIPMGYMFQKLYARNYKVYHKNDIWIWVRGKQVEIMDLYSNSKYAIRMILDGTFPVYKEDYYLMIKGKKTLWHKASTPMACMMNKKTGDIMEARSFRKKYDLDLFEYDYDLYRELRINTVTYNTVLELKDMIEL